MSSPMMNRILGFCCWAVAIPANSGMAARMATTVHIRSLATTALVFIHSLLSCPAWCRAFDIGRPSSLQAGGRYPALLHPHERYIKALLEGGLVIDALELIARPVVPQRISGPGIMHVTQFKKNLHGSALL